MIRIQMKMPPSSEIEFWVLGLVKKVVRFILLLIHTVIWMGNNVNSFINNFSGGKSNLH